MASASGLQLQTNDGHDALERLALRQQLEFHPATQESKTEVHTPAASWANEGYSHGGAKSWETGEMAWTVENSWLVL